MIRRFMRGTLVAALAWAAGRGVAQPAGNWSLYIDFTFTAESHEIRDADRTKARRVADYMSSHPALRVGLDGMNSGRVASVRDALLGAGVPPSRILVGTFAEPRMRAAQRVLVMVGP